MTNEGSFSVFTVTVQADIRVQVTFIDVDACPHVHRGHETIIAQTAVFSGDVRALAAVADIWCVFTLVDVSAGPEVRHERVSFAAAAFVASLRVCAVCVAAAVHDGALVDIHTALSVGRHLVSRFT